MSKRTKAAPVEPAKEKEGPGKYKGFQLVTKTVQIKETDSETLEASTKSVEVLAKPIKVGGERFDPGTYVSSVKRRIDEHLKKTKEE